MSEVDGRQGDHNALVPSLLVVQTALVTQETDHCGGPRDRSPQGQCVAFWPFQQEGVDVLVCVIHFHGVPVVSDMLNGSGLLHSTHMPTSVSANSR